MKIFTAAQIHELDKYTIENEPIKSVDLMERAAKSVVGVITERWSREVPVVVFAGPGNNGGSALSFIQILGCQDGLYHRLVGTPEPHTHDGITQKDR